MDVLNKDEEEELLSVFDENTIITGESAISWDGRNLFVRIPKEIADFLNLTKENRFDYKMKFNIFTSPTDRIEEFKIISREKKNGKTKKD